MKKMLGGYLLLAAMIAVPCAATNYYVVGPGQSVPTPPWTNWAWAHTNLIEVVARCRDGDTVYVTNNSTCYLTNQISISYAVNVRSWAPDGGLDPDTTILNGNYPDTTNRIFYLNNYGAWIRGLTLTNGCFWSTSTNQPWTGGGAAHIFKGHLANCIISGNRNYHNFDGSANGGGAIYLGGGDWRSGTVSNCKITGNISTNNGGGGVKVCYGGPWLLDNCELSYNETTNSLTSAGGGLSAYMPIDLELRDCQIFSNISRVGGGGVAMSTGGRLTRCRIYGNMSRTSSGGGAQLGAHTLSRNCLIYNNTCLPGGSSIGGGVYFTGGTNGLIQNCTIYSNTASYGGGLGFYNTTGFIDNCVVWGNSGSPSNYTVDGSAVCYMTNCCTAPDPAAAAPRCVATDCITAPPRFAGAAAGDLRLSPDSPCVNAGVNREWMAAGLDFDGLSRIDRYMRRVDMGCYEYLPRGTLFSFQ